MKDGDRSTDTLHTQRMRPRPSNQRTEQWCQDRTVSAPENETHPFQQATREESKKWFSLLIHQSFMSYDSNVRRRGYKIAVPLRTCKYRNDIAREKQKRKWPGSVVPLRDIQCASIRLNSCSRVPHLNESVIPIVRKPSCSFGTVRYMTSIVAAVFRDSKKCFCNAYCQKASMQL